MNTSGEGREVPPERNAKCEAKWKTAAAELLRFVDDGFCLSKINFENSFGFKVNDVSYRVKYAIQPQNVFRHLVRKAEAIGMKVNRAKTTMVCFSDSLAYKADAYIEDADGNRIGCQDNMKALGMHFSNRPDMSAHVDWIRRTYRECFWMLRNLKRNGFTNPELVQVYKTMIRPVAEYSCVIYHSSLKDEQDELLDNLQNHALRCIFKSEKRLSGRKLREMAGVETLRKRREDLCDKFAEKCVKNPCFSHFRGNRPELAREQEK